MLEQAAVLLEKIKASGNYDYDKILKAYEYAEQLHSGQKRISGESYIVHPLSVAEIIFELQLDTDSICAAMLHDTVEDCADKIDLVKIRKEFGADVTININEVKTLEERETLVKELTDGRGVNMALEVTGFAGAFEEGIHHLAIMGRYVVIGINSTAVNATISPGYITRKALTVYGVVRYLPEYLHKSLLFLEKNQDKYPFKDFSERTFALEELEEALQLSADRKITRAIIRP